LKFHFRDISGFLSKKKGFFEVRFFGLISYSSSRSNAPAMGRSRDKDFFLKLFLYDELKQLEEQKTHKF